LAGLDTNTKLLFHFNGPNGTKEIIDDGNTGHIMTQFATAQLDTSVKQFGSTSLLLDGNSDYISTPDSPDWDVFGSNTDDWTIHFWVKHNSLAGVQIYVTQDEGEPAGENRWYVVIDSFGQLFFVMQDNSGTATFAPQTAIGTISDLNLHHVAAVKIGDEVAIYVDGVQESYQQVVGFTTRTFNGPLNIGRNQWGSSQHLNGNIDEVVIENSNIFTATPNAGLTDTITVPTSEYTSNVNTKLLLHLNTQDVSGDGGSNLYHIPSFGATAQLDTSIKKFGASSIFLDGNSDFVRLPDSSDWDIAKDLISTHTIDFWVKHRVASPMNQVYMSHGDNTSNVWNLQAFVTPADQIRFFLRVFPNPDVDIRSSIGISDTNFHHIVLFLQGNVVAIYVDGVQGAFGTRTVVGNFSAPLDIGRQGSGLPDSAYVDGNIDEFRIGVGNPFQLNPNVGLTDTYIVPTQEYSVGIAPSDDGFRINKFLGIHEYVEPTKILNLNKFSGEHYKNYDKQ